jgi:hypothetical protein
MRRREAGGSRRKEAYWLPKTHNCLQDDQGGSQLCIRVHFCASVISCRRCINPLNNWERIEA